MVTMMRTSRFKWVKKSSRPRFVRGQQHRSGTKNVTCMCSLMFSFFVSIELYFILPIWFRLLADMDQNVCLNVYHRNLLGLDEFLGNVTLPLKQFQIYERPKNRYDLISYCSWNFKCKSFSLRSKVVFIVK